MKCLFGIVSLTVLLCIGVGGVNAQTSNQGLSNKSKVTMGKNNAKVTAILKAVELYAEAGRKGSREIGKQAFTEQATMSWVENGKITTVPISALYDGLEQTGQEEVTYEVLDVNIAGNVAFVRIDSWFSKLGSFNDMFTLAEQNGEWKIVNKIYSVK